MKYLVIFIDQRLRWGLFHGILIPVFGKIGNGNHVIRIPMDLLSRSINKSV